MIAVPAGVRVLVATKPVDFRRGADRLAALVGEQLRTNVTANSAVSAASFGFRRGSWRRSRARLPATIAWSAVYAIFRAATRGRLRPGCARALEWVYRLLAELNRLAPQGGPDLNR
jgi:hypothetical protein